MAKPAKKWTKLADFGAALRGLGGLQTANIKALKGSTFGPASEGRVLPADERRRVEEQMRKDGKI